MKYFTLGWWEANQRDTPADEIQRPIQQYKHYYAAIQEQLPPRFTEFRAACSLHDAAFRSLEMDVPRQSIRLSLLLSVRHGTVQEEREGVLMYEGVTYCGSSEAAQVALAGPGGHGDLGYDEIEALPAGFEHRLLFSSGIEYSIRFSGFDFAITGD